MEKVRPHVHYCTHQQPPGAASHGEDAIRVGIVLPNQMFGAGNEVGEGILFLQQLPVLIPPASQLLSSSNVGDCINEAAVEQADAVGIEPGVHTRAVGAVTVK